MGAVGIYKVVVDCSEGQARCIKEYVGPAASESDAVEHARALFKEGAACRVQKVEVLDRDTWEEDVILPPDGDDRIPL